MSTRVPPIRPVYNNPLNHQGKEFRQDCLERSHQHYRNVRDWMEEHGGPPTLDGDREEQEHAIRYSASKVYHLLSQLVWSEPHARTFEQHWPVAIESADFREHLHEQFPKVERFLNEMHRRDAERGLSA